MGKAIEKSVRLDRVLLDQIAGRWLYTTGHVSTLRLYGPHKRAMTLIEGTKMAERSRGRCEIRSLDASQTRFQGMRRAVNPAESRRQLRQ
jgi:hypothetical protein